jgi:hypothetical protein
MPVTAPPLVGRGAAEVAFKSGSYTLVARVRPNLTKLLVARVEIVVREPAEESTHDIRGVCAESRERARGAVVGRDDAEPDPELSGQTLDCRVNLVRNGSARNEHPDVQYRHRGLRVSKLAHKLRLIKRC